MVVPDVPCVVDLVDDSSSLSEDYKWAQRHPHEDSLGGLVRDGLGCGREGIFLDLHPI